MLTKGDVKAEKMCEGAKEGEKESRREGGRGERIKFVLWSLGVF